MKRRQKKNAPPVRDDYRRDMSGLVMRVLYAKAGDYADDIHDLAGRLYQSNGDDSEWTLENFNKLRDAVATFNTIYKTT